MHRRPVVPPREIGVVMLSALGDVVHAMPVVSALGRAWPDARITWFIQPLSHQLVRHHPAVDSFELFRRRSGLAAIREYADFRRRIAGRHFDLLLDLQIAFKAGVLTALIDAEVKLGFDRARAGDANWLFTNRRIPPHPPQHVQDQLFEFLEYLGIDPAPVEWNLTLTEAEERARDRFFAGFDRPACAFVVASSHPEKNWEPERYAHAMDIVDRDLGLQPVIVGGPSAVERAAADEVLRTTSSQPIDALADDVRRLVQLLDGSAVVVSPDSGPLHIARALDTPVVGLYGRTNPKRHGPYGRFGDLVVDGYARFPGEEYVIDAGYRPEGMGRVRVEQVVEKVELALRRYVG